MKYFKMNRSTTNHVSWYFWSIVHVLLFLETHGTKLRNHIWGISIPCQLRRHHTWFINCCAWSAHAISWSFGNQLQKIRCYSCVFIQKCHAKWERLLTLLKNSLGSQKITSAYNPIPFDIWAGQQMRWDRKVELLLLVHRFLDNTCMIARFAIASIQKPGEKV